MLNIAQSQDLSKQMAYPNAKESPQSPISVAHSSIEAARQLCDRVRKIADTLVGPVPCNTGEMGKQEAVDGVLHHLSAAATDMRKDIDAAHAALTRIENALP